MRGYMELIDFMRDLGDGIQDHLPEEQRTSQLSLEKIVEEWVDKKSYFAIRSLEKDIVSYVKKYNAGDYAVDQIFSDFDLVFIPERFGCEESVLLEKVLLLMAMRVHSKNRTPLNDFYIWLSAKFKR